MTSTKDPDRAVLDTSVIIATDVAPIPGMLAISSITLAELQRFDALPVDDAVAVSYGRLAAAVVESGRQPRRRARDLLIAATAHAHGACLYTRNPADFAGLEGLVEVEAV